MSEADEKAYCIREVIAHGRRAIAAGFMPDDHVHACPVCFERRICRDGDCHINVHENGEPYGDIVECDACSPPAPTTESRLQDALARADKAERERDEARACVARHQTAETCRRERQERRRAQAAESRAAQYERWCWALLGMWGRAKNRIAARDAHLVERVARLNPRRPPDPMPAEHGFHCDDCDRDDTPIVCEVGGGESPEPTYRCVPCEMLYLLNMQEWGHDLMSEDRARAVERARVDTLRLMYIAASCADEQANALATEHSERVELWAHLVATAHRSRGVAIAVLNALAELGDETAIGLLAGDL